MSSMYDKFQLLKSWKKKVEQLDTNQQMFCIGNVVWTLYSMFNVSMDYLRNIEKWDIDENIKGGGGPAKSYITLYSKI